ncbi:MAG: fimbrial protein [Bdellovibrionales bacterium]|nr:fimbrial protein [Oligoflexia bacterium]
MNKLLVGLLLVSSAAQAATTGTLSLSGTIANVISIAVAAAGAASTLDLTATQTNLVVATVTENSNSNTGYTISARSTNTGTIKHATATDNVAYTMKYAGGTATSLTTVDQTVKTQSTGGVYSAVSSSVSVSYTGNASLRAGSYSDTITFTIAAI